MNALCPECGRLSLRFDEIGDEVCHVGVCDFCGYCDLPDDMYIEDTTEDEWDDFE